MSSLSFEYKALGADANGLAQPKTKSVRVKKMQEKITALQESGKMCTTQVCVISPTLS